MSSDATASKRLLRALRDSARRDEVDTAFEPIRERRWESATFSGHRHEIAGSGAASPSLERWLASLRDCDLPMPGHVVADVAVTRRSNLGGIASFTIEALTIAE